MHKPGGIIVFGANGSGKTTLGRELARILGFFPMDIEDYHFAPSEIPYTIERPREECLALMLADIRKHGSFVLSAVTGDFGDEITSAYRLAVFLAAPKELRMQRIEQRAYRQYGERVRKGGDMYDGRQRFMDFAANRPLERIDNWAKTLACPVIHMDGTLDWRRNAASIAECYASSPASVI